MEDSGPKGNLRLRLLTAAVFVPALWMALLLDPTVWSILAFTLLAAVMAGDEYLRMALPWTRDEPALGLRTTFGVVSVSLIGLSTFWGPSAVVAPVLTAGAIALSLIVLLRHRQLAHGGRQLAACLAGLLYVPLLACVWPALKYEYGGRWLYVAIGTAFISDSVAYFAGRAFGRHKLYPAVSPKKTIEGSLGGLVGGVMAQLGFGVMWLLPELPISHAIALGLLGSALGQVGDLVESMIKRTFQVKDSGSALPGHGGMLDRIDALLFVAPLMYFYCYFFVG